MNADHHQDVSQLDAAQLAALVAVLQRQVQDLQAGQTAMAQLAAQAGAAAQAAIQAAAAKATVPPASSASASSKSIRRPEPFEGRFGQGEKLEEWLYKMDLYLQATQVPDQLRVITTVSFLQGNAMTWWRAMIGSRDPTTITWQDFTTHIRKEFVPTNAVKSAREKLKRLAQHSSVAAYVRDFRNLALQIPDMSDAEKLDRFVTGLKPQVRRDVDQFDPSTFDDAVARAERADNLNFYSNSRLSFNSPNRFNSLQEDSSSQVPRSTPMDLSSMRATGSSNNINSRSRQFTKLTPQEREKLRRENKCFYCREGGHPLSKCPRKPRSPSSGNAGRQ